MLKGNFVLVGITFVFSARDYFIFIYVCFWSQKSTVHLLLERWSVLERLK